MVKERRKERRNVVTEVKKGAYGGRERREGKMNGRERRKGRKLPPLRQRRQRWDDTVVTRREKERKEGK